MPFAYRGITHCSECGKKLKIGELAICKECENKEKEISEKIKTHGNSMTEEEAIEYLREISIDITGVHFEEVKEIILNLIEKLKQEIEEINKTIENGTLSDGYHTFNDLYYQRCVLFATICNSNKSISWKSKKHSDGNKCFDSDNWFIVGIDTPKGSYTYHYEIKYWDLFKVPELEFGKEWDGHTEKDVTRLLSLINNNITKDKIKIKFKSIINYFEKMGTTNEDISYLKLKEQELLKDI